MKHTRRDILALAGLAGLGAMAPKSLAASAEMPLMTGRVGRVQLVPGDYPQTEIWGYDGRLPGPEIRLKQGERVRRRFLNELPQPSSVHWHGVRLDNAMDGVAGLTQAAVEPGDSFDYDFVAPDAGTFWFHAHNRSVEQVARGLYGALIVEEAQAPDIDREEVLILDDWLLDPGNAQIAPDFEAMHDLSHAGRFGNYIATNATDNLSFEVKRHERLRLRLINAANARIFELRLAGLDGWAMALDGMPLSRPEKVEGAIYLGPGQRVDLFVDVIADEGEAAHLARVERDGAFSQVAFEVGKGGGRARRGPPSPLPANPRMEVPGLAEARRLKLVMEGGAMGRMREATLDGERLSMRQLAGRRHFWAFNGVAGMTDTPFASLARGETVRVEIVNDTAFPHAMHLHGMHFRELLADAEAGPLRDTLLMDSGERREIGFVAHTPGKWLFHCHMLSHAASGMTTWIEVA